MRRWVANRLLLGAAGGVEAGVPQPAGGSIRGFLRGFGGGASPPGPSAAERARDAARGPGRRGFAGRAGDPRGGAEGGGPRGGGGAPGGAGPLTALVVLFPVVTAGLGGWQLQRRAWKQGVLAEVEARLAAPPVAAAELPDAPAEFTRVRLAGEYRGDRTVLVGPRTRSVRGTAQVGSQMIVPMELEGGGTVLVNRGWVPFHAAAGARPGDAGAATREWQARGPVCEEGVVRASETPSASLGPRNDPAAGVWTWVDVPGIAESLGLPRDTPLVDVVSESGDAREKMNPIAALKVASGRIAGGLPDESYPMPRSPSSYRRQYLMPEDHLTYALTWFSISGVTAYMARRLLRGLPALG